jgi:small nuclear ribonucleoprotein (snRNP)-like protein
MYVEYPLFTYFPTAAMLSVPRDTKLALGILEDRRSTVDKSANDTFAQVFMNIVLDEAWEEKEGAEKVAIGMVVRRRYSLLGPGNSTNNDTQVIRGNSVVMLEALERITDK